VSNKAFPFFYDWSDELKELDADIFKRFVLALSEYHQTKNKAIIERFKGVERVCLANMINQFDRLELKRIAGRKGGKKTVENKSGVFSVLEAGLKQASSTNTNTNTNTDTNTDTNTNNPPLISPQGEKKRLEKQFNEFWKSYPKKQGKKTAQRAYLKLKPSPELHKDILEALEKHIMSQQWQEESGKFIPLPTTWLNQERWNDELSPGKLVPNKADDWSGLDFNI